MGWEETAKKLGEQLEKQKIAKMTEERQREKEYKRVRSAYTPRVKNVCKHFARSINGELETIDYDERYTSWGSEPRAVRSTIFTVKGPKGEYGVRQHCDVSISIDRISVVDESRNVTDYIPLTEFTEDRLGEALVRYFTGKK